MKYKVNENCIACGMCTTVCPEVFSMSDSGYAEAIHGDIPKEAEESAQEAASGCPVDAIESEP
jgi:ferredoxin